MELPESFQLHLMTPPEQASKAAQYALTCAQLAYRVGNGPHLFRTQGTLTRSGGILVADHRGFSGQGNPESFCQEVIRECSARSFQGAFFDFEGPVIPVLKRSVELLAPVFQARRWTLYVPEHYALSSPCVKVVISTALSGGSLRQRLTQVAETYGPERVALGLEWVAEDFTLPAPDGSGTHLEQEDLDRLLAQRSPAVYFSDELCAHYFTYMHTGQNAHFTLYDDPSSMAKKLFVAAGLGIREGFLPDPQRDGFLRELFQTTA